MEFVCLLLDGTFHDKLFICCVLAKHYLIRYAAFNCIASNAIIIKLCCYVIRSTRSPEGSPRPPGWPQVSPAADSPREIWWAVSHNYTVLSLSRDVKNTKFSQYLPVDLTSLNVSNSRFRKPVMFRRWRRHGIALWRHGRGAWHNCLLLATSTAEPMLLTTWLDCGNRVIRKISNAGSRASYGPYHSLELPNHVIKSNTVS